MTGKLRGTAAKCRPNLFADRKKHGPISLLPATGMVDELSEQTGLDSDTAARGLQEAFEMLGGQLSQGQ